VFDAKVFDDSQPFMEIDNYAVEPAAVSTSQAFPVSDVPPWNKIQHASLKKLV